MDGRNQENQEASGQHRDAQGKPNFSFIGTFIFARTVYNTLLFYKHFHVHKNSYLLSSNTINFSSYF